MTKSSCIAVMLALASDAVAADLFCADQAGKLTVRSTCAEGERKIPVILSEPSGGREETLQRLKIEVAKKEAQRLETIARIRQDAEDYLAGTSGKEKNRDLAIKRLELLVDLDPTDLAAKARLEEISPPNKAPE